MAANEDLSVGDLAAFVALIATLLPYMRSMGWLLSVWQRGSAALERIYELLDSEIERPEIELGVLERKQKTGPEIEIRNLSFAYPSAPEQQIFSKFSCHLQAGSTTGIFGKTGSGKSTLLSLLSRQYNPPPDSIFIDGVDICRLDLFDWRRTLSYVPQQPFLFSDTITNNISMTDLPDAERIEEVVRLSSLEQDLDVLPDGLDTVVGERGIILSGGQRQRVALARGLYHEGALILLDDVLSAVDHENEKRLVKTLKNLTTSRTYSSCLIVSNRISAFRHADLILVMENGELVDQGTHAELITRPGIYQESWLVQKDSSEEIQKRNLSMEQFHG